MLIHSKLASSTVNGPGTRAVIWLQGCTLNCTGCWNPNTHKFDASTDTPVSELQTWLLNLDGIEGVTFSGGESLQHVIELLPLAKFIREVRPELSIGIFTGYTARELETWNWQTLHPAGVMIPGSGEVWEKFRAYLDFAVMGRFNASKLTTKKPLCGSTNQDIILFTDRYNAGDFTAQETQITIDGDGLVQITGFPGREFIEAVKGMN